MADQHNSNIPAMGNQISSDIPDIKENLEYHKDVLQNFVNAWSDTTASGIYPVTMADADADTLIQLEESADEDTIRFDCGGTEYMRINAANGVVLDTLNEHTSENGITVDGLSIKDSKLATANSVVETNLTASIVSQSKLKTSTQEVTTTQTSTTLVSVANVGSYGFYPQVKGSGANVIVTAGISGGSAPGTSYVTVVAMSLNLVGTGYCQFRYVTSSGEVFWVFFLVDKNTKNILTATAGPDHPCLGNGGKPNLMPHPFMDYDSSKHEIYVFNPDEKQLEAFRSKCFVDDDDTPDRSILQVIMEDYELDFSQSPKWTDKLVTVRLNNDDWNNPQPASITKKKIPQPDYIKTVGLKVKK